MNKALDNQVRVAIEKVEREAWFDMYAAAPDDYMQSSKLASARLGASIVLADHGTPIAEFNRVLGIGIDEPASEKELEQVIAWLNEHAAPSYALQVAPTAHPEAIGEWIEARGLQLAGNGWAKHYRDASPVEEHPIPTALEVKRAKPHHASDFGNVAQAGFGLPVPIAAWLSALAGRPNWHVYVAYEGQVPVACGAMFVENNWAWLGVDATLADYRGRGAQNALIKQRLADGIAAGVIGFTAETGQPPEGQAELHKSYCNYVRAGFKQAYVRPNYVTKA